MSLPSCFDHARDLLHWMALHDARLSVKTQGGVHLLRMESLSPVCAVVERVLTREVVDAASIDVWSYTLRLLICDIEILQEESRKRSQAAWKRFTDKEKGIPSP